MSAYDIHKLNRDLDAIFEKIANQDRENVTNLRTAFQMLAEMGYTADEAKEEFTRFQAQYNADNNHSQGQATVRRQRAIGSCSRSSTKCRMSGVQRYSRAFMLCLVIIPILFFVGLVTEIWFYYNPWGRAFLNVRYAKAILYIGVWYSMMKTFLPRFVANALTVLFVFAGIGMILSCEPLFNEFGKGLFGNAWIPFWIRTQWIYWGLLTVTYLYAWCKLAHGPRHWILKYGIN